MTPRLAHAGLVALVLCGATFAATTKTWELNTAEDFLKGRLESLSVTPDGQLVMAPAIDTVYTSDQPEIWSVAQAPDGAVYMGTGDRGQLYRVDREGNATLVWTADEPEIFAIAVAPDGVVYAGSSPNGKVYRIENGQATEYFAPESPYIWSLAVAANGDLFVGTGDQGKIFRVTGPGQGELYYETGQSHVTALAFDGQNRLLAGSEPNGILYRITGPNRAFVLYDANLPEIRTIVAAPDGNIYAAALGGGVSRQATAAYTAATNANAVRSGTTTSITVNAQEGTVPQPQAGQTATVTSSTSTPAATTASTTFSGERSALYRIQPDNTVETLWSSNEENIYDLALEGPASSSVVFLTDAQGRIYRLGTNRRATLLAQTNEGDATRLLATANGTLAATGHLARLLRISGQPASEGSYESAVHDAGTVARWGRLSWNGGSGDGSGALRGVRFRTRSGNSSRPDATWSDWSDPIDNPDRAGIESPNARYIQWRAEFSGRGAQQASLDNVTVFYLPQNTAPTVRSISVTSQSTSDASSNGSSSQSSSGSVFSISVTASGAVSTAAGTDSQTVSRPAGQRLQISWQADDPDGDSLLYALYFRGDGETEWKLLRDEMTQNQHSIGGDALADGRYFFRVTASDRLTNPLSEARTAELTSTPVLIDNTPPVVETSNTRRNGNRLEARIEATDRGSVLRRCEYSIDAGPWTPVEAADGVTDSAEERFDLAIDGLPAGEHLVTVRVYDAAGNAGLAKVVAR